jgi:hypothetical protein
MRAMYLSHRMRLASSERYIYAYIYMDKESSYLPMQRFDVVPLQAVEAEIKPAPGGIPFMMAYAVSNNAKAVPFVYLYTACPLT